MMRSRRILVGSLCLTTAAISAAMFVKNPSGRVAWILCLLGAVGSFYRELVPRRSGKGVAQDGGGSTTER